MMTLFNHFFEHFDDSSYYHAIQYETDPEIAAVMVTGIDFLYTKAHLHGNGHLLFDVATYRPWTDAAAMGALGLVLLFGGTIACIALAVRGKGRGSPSDEFPSDEM